MMNNQTQSSYSCKLEVLLLLAMVVEDSTTSLIFIKLVCRFCGGIQFVTIIIE